MQVTQNSPRIFEMEPQIAGMATKRMAAVAVADASKRELDALRFRYAELDSGVTRLDSKVNVVKRLRAKTISLGRDVEKTAASLTDTANMHDEAVERAYNLGAPLAANVRREEAYKLDLTAVEEDLVKTRVERAKLQMSVSDLVAEVRQAFVDFGVAFLTVVVSSNRLFEDAADRVKMEVSQAWKRMLCSLDAEYANAVGKVRAKVLWDTHDVLWNVARCTAINLARLDKIGDLLPVEGESDKADAGFSGTVETLGEATINCEGPTVE